MTGFLCHDAEQFVRSMRGLAGTAVAQSVICRGDFFTAFVMLTLQESTPTQGFFLLDKCYKKTCAAFCEAQFARHLARLLSDSELEELRIFSDLVVGSDGHNEKSLAAWKLFATATTLIKSTLVRYRVTGPRSVAKINFIEDVPQTQSK